MNSFNWKAGYDARHASYPGYVHKPVIGITGNFGDKGCELGEAYYQSVLEAGCTPLIIPPYADNDALCTVLDTIDGLLLSGGADINPLYLGEEPLQQLHGINPRRDAMEMLLTRMAYDRQLPILGICRGIQVLAASLDGKLHQDIYTQAAPPTSGCVQSVIKHSQDLERGVASHTVRIDVQSMLYSIMQTEVLPVNSFHHQAVSESGPRLRVVAQSPDGIIEAVESSEHKSVLGVQWHPECFIQKGDESMMPLFRWLRDEAALYREARNVHQQVLTLDSHEDTPMFFSQGVRFDHREQHVLVDLHKMNEGGLDAGVMVAYIPQKERDEAGLEAATEYAQSTLDKLRQMVERHHQYVEIARTTEDLYRLKAAGKKAIMMGIENGYAIGRDLSLLEHFSQMGVVYITLCHNGDNDICDSARKSNQEHGGLSAFGRKVVAEMNRLGLLIDLSHAAESTFWQVLDLSQKPVACSHSSCKALCDHPRNLTDEQMKALAAKDGVMQVTIYNGFLRTDGNATLDDVVQHINHAVEVMGIDHVGIGTDFDGDGGVPGVDCASALLNLTKALLRQGYTHDDLRKLWGANFVRVLQSQRNN